VPSGITGSSQTTALAPARDKLRRWLLIIYAPMPRHSLLKDQAELIGLAARVLDVLSVLLAGWVAWQLWLGDGAPLLALTPATYAAVTLGGAVLVLLSFPSFDVYLSWRGRALTALAARLLLAWLVALALLTVGLFVMHLTHLLSRGWFLLWAGLAFAAMFGGRLAIFALLRLLRARGQNHKRVIVFGAGPVGRALLERSTAERYSGFEVVALFDDNPELRDQPAGSLRVRHDAEALPALLAAENVDELWLALPLRAERRVRELMQLVALQPVTVRLVPDIFGFRLLNHSLTEILGMPMISLSASPFTGFSALVKQLEDGVLTLLLLIPAVPLMLLISLAIRLDSPGPILFRQRRHGLDGCEIVVWKFRTMYQQPQPDCRQASRDDPRVTRVGRWLRRLSLDELPQLFNVLQGRMSLVGPRPHAVEHNEQFKHLVAQYMLRHTVRPGITGWAQVHGLRGEIRSLEDMQRRVEYDLWYIEHWSLWLDLRILLLTALRGFAHPNAY